MRKILILQLVFIALSINVVFSQAVEKAPLYGVVCASMWTDGSIKSPSGGLKLGTEISLDANKGLYIRTLYNRYNVGQDNPLETIDISFLLDWYIGKKWTFYTEAGGANNINGDNEGTDFFGGFGTTRRLWTDNDESWLVPGSIDGFAEVSFIDADGQPTGKYFEFTLGIKISKPIKK